MIGEAISAVGNIASGIFGASAAKKAAEVQYRQQKEFAQNGIQWKVADAKEAGIHPLYALGANTVSYAPVSVGNTNPAAGLAEAGQNIGRAIDATRPAAARLDAYTQTAQQLSLTRMGLENELLASQIATTRQNGATPPMPTAGDRMLIPGQGNSPITGAGAVKTSPMARQSTDPNSPSQEAGAVSEMGYTRTPTGWAPVMSKDAKDRSEDDIGAELAWSLRNRLLPEVAGGEMQPPASVKLKSDEYWRWNSLKQQYEIHKYPTGFFTRNRLGGAKYTR